MTWRVLILLAAALTAEAYSNYHHDYSERLAHGRQLKITLHENTEKMEFISVHNPTSRVTYWERYKHSRPLKGRVSGTGSSRRWYIDKVTFDDEGTYVLKDTWNRDISTVKVAVILKRNYQKYIAGESLYIQLEGLEYTHAELSFSGPAGNFTLVRDGAPVAQDLPEYWDRVKVHSSNIEIVHVNTSDEGRYILKDNKNRVVSLTRMDLTDHHEYESANPLMALLLLLGIPAGICCCCRKKIFKKKAATATTVQTSAEIVHTPPAGPAGPCPSYASGQPGEVHYYGPSANTGPMVHPPPASAGPPPSPGFNPAYPPQNPSYPPQNPSFPPQNPSFPPQNPSFPPQNPSFPPQNPSFPPQNPAYPPPGSAPDPQWGYAPPSQYPPAPVAPMAYAPAGVMYSAPPPGAEPVLQANVQNVASPGDPLLTAAPQGEAAPVLNSDGAVKFQIDTAKDNVNFL
ncbi:wu:fc21g02 [Cololabis saira]|uniref:wu:fc21g02 n=1 Tax=Cololabis saira TaxID=129043 RepID=UPI002AD51F8A|nr:wu:fc21g02 [Cololabis saira]